MNPLLEWILHHQRADWASAQTRANYERINGTNYVQGGTPAQQQAAGDAAWARARGQAFQQERVRDALLGVRPSQDVASALFGRLAGARGTITVPVLALGTGFGGVTAAREIEVEVPGSATGAEMQQLIDDAVAALPDESDVTLTDGIIMYGATAA